MGSEGWRTAVWPFVGMLGKNSATSDPQRARFPRCGNPIPRNFPRSGDRSSTGGRGEVMAKTSEKSEAAQRSGNVQSVDRAMLLLEILGEDAEGYRLTDLALRSGLSVSTTHRLLTT